MDAYNSKRKKRKTRKCLDEIRKRSRLYSNYDSRNFNKNVEIRLNDSSNVTHKKLSNITTNRLTLSMFHKAVRSETITRPILSEISHAPFLNVNNILKGKITTQGVTQSKSVVIDRDSSHSSEQNHIKYIDFDSYDVVKKIHRNDCDSVNNCSGNSPNSFMLFSPLNQSLETEAFEDSDNQEQMPQLNIQILPSIQESHNLYEKVIQEIPKFIKENASVLLQEDAMAKTRALLHNIYMERQCHDLKIHYGNSFGNDDVSYMSVSPMTTIVQNPVDYIRLGQVWKRNTHPIRNHTSCCSSETPLSSLPPCSPEDPQLPFIHCSVAPCSRLRSCSPPTSDSPPVLSVISDTPEYTYYPHKLIQ